jgi:hypothetical protein
MREIPVGGGLLGVLQDLVDEGPEGGVGRFRIDRPQAALEGVLPGASAVGVGLAGGEAQTLVDQSAIGTRFRDPGEGSRIPVG